MQNLHCVPYSILGFLHTPQSPPFHSHPWKPPPTFTSSIHFITHPSFRLLLLAAAFHLHSLHPLSVLSLNCLNPHPQILFTFPALPPYPISPHTLHPLYALVFPISPHLSVPPPPFHSHPVTLLPRPSNPTPALVFATHAAPHSCSALLTTCPAGARTMLSPKPSLGDPERPLELSGQLLFARSHTQRLQQHRLPPPPP